MKTIDNTQANADIKTEFRDYSGRKVFECRAFFFAEPVGGYSVIASNLPGVVSEGDDLREAIANIKEAFAASVESYLEAGEVIPWKEVTDFDSDPAKQLYFTVSLDD